MSRKWANINIVFQEKYKCVLKNRNEFKRMYYGENQDERKNHTKSWKRGGNLTSN